MMTALSPLSLNPISTKSVPLLRVEICNNPLDCVGADKKRR